MIRDFPRGSGAGPSGFRPQHLKDALSKAHADEVTHQLTLVCNVLARGEAPAQLAPFLGGASLSALPKKDGGLRPIAVGETFRRSVGKLCSNGIKEKAQLRLSPLQVGVAVPSGAEAAVISCSCRWAVDAAQQAQP